MIALQSLHVKAVEKSASLSQWYTKASEDIEHPPFSKYTLRGVSSAKDTTYVLRRTVGSDDNIVDDEASNEWQWWRLSYQHGQHNAVLRNVS